MDISKAIGFRVKQAREYRNLTQDELAEKLDVSTSFISRLETGKAMTSIATLYKISLVLDIAFQDLVRDLFTLAPATPDSIELEILQKLHTLSFSNKQHILKYLELFDQYLSHSQD